MTDRDALLRHTGVGASWETLVIEEILRRAPGESPYFWRTSNGAELDLLLDGAGRRLGFEVKRTDAPRLTMSMRSALDDLELDRLGVVYPGDRRYAITDRTTALPLREVVEAESVDDLLL